MHTADPNNSPVSSDANASRVAAGSSRCSNAASDVGGGLSPCLNPTSAAPAEEFIPTRSASPCSLTPNATVPFAPETDDSPVAAGLHRCSVPKAAISITDIPENTPICVEQDGLKVVLIRSGDAVFAYEDRCPHAFWPLSQGTVTGPVLECPGHGWEFDVSTGHCLTSPTYCLKPVPITVDGQTIILHRDNSP